MVALIFFIFFKGGMKAVVWADSFQVVVLYAAMIVILIKGTAEIGGFSKVWELNALHNRTDIFR